MRLHALLLSRSQRWLAAMVGAPLVLCLSLAARPPVAHAGAYPHLSAAAVARDRAAARAHAAALRSRKGASPPAALHGNPARALVAFDAMQRFFYVPGSGLYREEPYATSVSFLWPFSQALAATVSSSHIPGESRQLAPELGTQLDGLKTYLEVSPAAPAGSSSEPPTATLASYTAADSGGTSFYDDNEWLGIELVRVFELDRNLAALTQAEQIMAFVMAGWQGTSPHCPGGVPFSDRPSGSEERNVVSNAPAAELGVQLYRVTRNPTYLQFAEMAYDWVRVCLLQPGELYADHLEVEGEVEPTEWSYNQGSMIGAGVLLFQSTGDRSFLKQATATARAALAHFPLERLAGEVTFFPAVFFRNLLYLDSVTHEPTGRALAQSYVNYLWESLLLPSGLFLNAEGNTPQLLEQACIAQIYALLSTPASTYF